MSSKKQSIESQQTEQLWIPPDDFQQATETEMKRDPRFGLLLNKMRKFIYPFIVAPTYPRRSGHDYGDTPPVEMHSRREELVQKFFGPKGLERLIKLYSAEYFRTEDCIKKDKRGGVGITRQFLLKGGQGSGGGEEDEFKVRGGREDKRIELFQRRSRRASSGRPDEIQLEEYFRDNTYPCVENFFTDLKRFLPMPNCSKKGSLLQQFILEDIVYLLHLKETDFSSLLKFFLFSKTRETATIPNLIQQLTRQQLQDNYLNIVYIYCFHKNTLQEFFTLLDHVSNTYNQQRFLLLRIINSGIHSGFRNWHEIQQLLHRCKLNKMNMNLTLSNILKSFSLEKGSDATCKQLLSMMTDPEWKRKWGQELEKPFRTRKEMHKTHGFQMDIPQWSNYRKKDYQQKEKGLRGPDDYDFDEKIHWFKKLRQMSPQQSLKFIEPSIQSPPQNKKLYDVLGKIRTLPEQMAFEFFKLLLSNPLPPRGFDEYLATRPWDTSTSTSSLTPEMVKNDYSLTKEWIEKYKKMLRQQPKSGGSSGSSGGGGGGGSPSKRRRE